MEKFDINKYLEKYAEIRRNPLKRSYFGAIKPEKFTVRKKKKKLPNVDPGYIFLNSGRFAQLMLPPQVKTPKIEKLAPTEEQLTDILGNIINRSELYG